MERNDSSELSDYHLPLEEMKDGDDDNDDDDDDDGGSDDYDYDDGLFSSSRQSGIDSSENDYFASTEGLEDDNDNDNDNVNENVDDDDFHYKQRLPQPRPDPLYRGETDFVRRSAPQSVSFDRSVTRRTADDITKENGNSGYSVMSRQKRAASYSPRSKRSMEIRMDGRVIQLTHSRNGNSDNLTRELTPTQASDVDQYESSYAAPISITPSSVDCSPNGNTDVLSTVQTSYPGVTDTQRRTHSINNTHRIRDRESATLEKMDNNENTSSDGSDELTTEGFAYVVKKLFDVFDAHRISLCVVKSTPCFGFTQASASSDRFILARLNILSFFFATIQLVASLWLCVVLFIKGEFNNNGDFGSEIHIWNNNGSVVIIGCLALVLIMCVFWTVRIIKEVDLVGALRFLWLLLWILPLEAFLNISAFDYHHVTSIWVKHYWNSEQMWWFRKKYCFLETAKTLCMVPIDGGPNYVSENAWCVSKYNSTTCTVIRDEAQTEAEFWLLLFYGSLASMGCIYMFLMLLIIKSLERIISKPMVQKSREINVVGWLTFPVFCTALFGLVFLLTPYSSLDKLNEQRWIGYLYLITSCLFLIALLMGWFLSAFSIRSNIDKQNKSNAVLILILVLFLNAALLIAIFIASILWSYRMDLTELERGDIACDIKNSQCTGCDELGENRCPEWSFLDITNIKRRQLKQSATLAAIFLLYDINVTMHGLNLRNHLSMYQIDYV
mmetsp:Transcript_13315/g.14909  ORF Transcript_13315/g.14909 Transcript_13315/m.14909 type:complete len:726 (-) Transcript_13315:1524-3701(-)